MEENMIRKNIPSFVLGVLSLSLLACATLMGAPATPRLPPPTEPPLPTASLPTSSPEPVFTPTPEALLLDKTVFLTTVEISETNSSPLYTLHAETPVMQGSDDPRVIQFNEAVAALVQVEVTAFKEAAPEALDTPEGSSFDVSFAVISPPGGDLVSLQFGITGYSAGAAHPYHYTRTFNYQLSTGQELTLDQLFLPGADYLNVLADYCKAELQQRLGSDVFFVEGADPKPENYPNWNLSWEGVIITFDEYQVAPYAAGPQMIPIPYAVLKEIIDPQGPAAEF
jgi:hypothetical protein